MAEKLLMLALSPTMEEGMIISWHKKEGDSVAEGETLCEVETDKASMEYESVNSGTLLKILIPNGGQAAVGTAIAVVGEPGEDISGIMEEVAAEAARISGPGAAMEEVQRQAPPAERAAPAEPAETAVPLPAGTSAAGPQATSVLPAAPGDRAKASPLARRMAREQGVSLAGLRGSGPGGRIIKRDLSGLSAASRAAASAAAGRQSATVSPGSVAVPAQDERVPLSNKRKIIARRLAESKYSAPHYYLKIDVVMDEVLAARKRLNSRREEKISLNAFLIKFTAEALKKHARVNATWQDDSILRFGRIDIGLAVALEEGLITPVLRNCGQMGILEIDRELKVLIDKAINNKLALQEFTDATFTVTSLGSAGILEFTAIINPPGSAILAIGKIEKQPVVDDKDQVRIVSRMIMTMSCDHRVIDGAVGAEFLSDLKSLLEEPVRVLY